jgi:MFS family permease
MYIGAVGSLIALVLVWVTYRDPPGMAAGATKLTLALTSREWTLVIIAGAMWGLINVAYIVVVSFAPGLFAARGYSPAQASWVVSLLSWSLIVSIPFAGVIVEKVGKPNLMLAVSTVICAAALALVPLVGAPLIPFIVMGLVFSIPPGPVMALPAEAVRPQLRAGGMGVFYTCYYLFMALLPGVAGYALDVTRSNAAPVLFSAAMFLLCAVGLALFHAAKRIQAR